MSINLHAENYWKLFILGGQSYNVWMEHDVDE